ncbi:putative ribonuclease H-like domain-containing protein [Tanacetum coccineum]
MLRILLALILLLRILRACFCCLNESAGVDSADGVSTGSPSADSDPAVGNPADSFPPAGRLEPTDESNHAVSSSVSADFHPVYADESTLPPGQQLGSTLCEVNPVPTKGVYIIHPQSQFLGDLESPVMTRSGAQKSSLVKLEPTCIAKALEGQMDFEEQRDARGISCKEYSKLGCTGTRQVEAFVTMSLWDDISLGLFHKAGGDEFELVLVPVIKVTPTDSLLNLDAYSDSDYAGSHGDRKSTTGGCQFLGRRLISWQCKKQTIVATSSTEAEYVAAASLLCTVVNTAAMCTFSCCQIGFCCVARRLVSAGPPVTMILLVVILSAWTTGFCWSYYCSAAMDYAADSVYMLVGILLLVDSFLLIGCMFLLSTWFLLLDDSFCWLNIFMLLELFMLPIHLVLFDIAGWLVSATSHLVSASSIQSCWWNNVSAA